MLHLKLSRNRFRLHKVVNLLRQQRSREALNGFVRPIKRSLTENILRKPNADGNQIGCSMVRSTSLSYRPLVTLSGGGESQNNDVIQQSNGHHLTLRSSAYIKRRNSTEAKASLFSKDLVQDSPSLILGTGKIANLAKASVLAVMGDTVVLTTVVESSDGSDSSASFQNFTVDYRQRHHGVGKIPTGSASRRDNDRSTPSETLGSRAIDRALRPLIQDDKQNSSIHIHSSVQSCSAKGVNPIVLGINSASAALMTQDMLREPVAAVSVGIVAGRKGAPKVLFNPAPLLQQDGTSLACELLYAGTRTHAVMAEFQYHRQFTDGDTDKIQTSIPEDELVQLMSLAHAAIQPLLDTQEEFTTNNRGEQQINNDSTIEDENEMELRASLGLHPLPESDVGNVTGLLDPKEKSHELFEEALHVCEEKLKDATIALFGYNKLHDRGQKRPKPRDCDLKDYNRAYIHDDTEGAILPKSMRGKREQIISQEIQRILSDWLTKEKNIDSKDSESVELLSSLAETVQKKLFQQALCTATIEHGTRADRRAGGRPASLNDGYRTIRPLSLTVPALPEVVHGSALFARGDTQVLCTATLGPPQDGIPNRDPFTPPLPTPTLKEINNKKNDEQEGVFKTENGSSFEDLPVGSLRYLRTQEALVSDLNSRKSKADREMTGDSGNLWEYRRAFLQYDFPSFSTGEMPKGGGMAHNRRAIGHGALAEKAILPILPSPHDFPYALRITSEVTDSNGSSSMASVCGATLALLDAGVPIVAPVAGVSVGIALRAGGETAVGQAKSYELLLDITGTEDHYGAMDFKIAGTVAGVTALQLDVKNPLPLSVLPEALALAKAGRQEILKQMDSLCKETLLNGLKARANLKDATPRVEVVRFDPHRKRDLIGPGGAVLRQLEDRYDVSLDLTQEGQCLLFGSDKDMVAKARSAVADLVADVEVGEVYEGTIIEIKDFGAIVELLRNKSGLLHVSELTDEVSHPDGNLGVVQKHLKVGEKIKVLCTGIDPVQGSIRLSVKALQSGGKRLG